ncbi:MAG: hypothetical protein ABIV50_13805 [Opitutus sp.]
MNVEPTKMAFTPKEIRIFKIHAVIVAAITAGIFVLAPRGIGQLIGMAFAIIILPTPPLIVYFMRRRKTESKDHS